MPNEIVGRGWVFPISISPQGKLMLTDERNEIDQSIEIILSTYPGQRVMRPTFGSHLYELVFAPNNSQTAAQARRIVEEALGMWEPRIRVTQVEAVRHPKEENCLMIKIEYQVKTTHDRRSLVYPFYLESEKA